MHLSLSANILLLDIIVFTVYVVYVLTQFGIPINLSFTYYTFERKQKGLGVLFPLLMLFICGTTLPVWIHTTMHASPWAQQFLILPVVGLVCLMAVAATARYKMRQKLIIFHYAVAILAAVCAVAWIFLVAYSIVYIGLSILLICVLCGLLTKTLRKCTLFWLEDAAFYAIFFTLFVINLMPVHV